MFHGKGKGCRFLHANCSEFKEFCKMTDTGLCSLDYKGKAICVNETVSETCPYLTHILNGNCTIQNNSLVRGVSNRGEKWGFNSGCVAASLRESNLENVDKVLSLCLEFYCTNIKEVVFLPLDGTSLVCSWEGQIVYSLGKFSGYVVCPNPFEYCKDYNINCPNYCSYRGSCRDGSCLCRAGFTFINKVLKNKNLFLKTY